MRGWLIGTLIAVTVILGAFALLFAQGAPVAPTAQLYTPINPGTAQSLLFNVHSGEYSISAPNSVWDLGQHFTVSAVELTSAGGAYTLASNLTVGYVTTASSGLFYQILGTFSLTTVAACSGGGCAGVTENITLTLSVSLSTPLVVWVSPHTTSLFSSLNAVSCGSGSPCAPISTVPANLPTTGIAAPTTLAANTFYLELVAPLSLLVAVDAFGAYAAGMRHISLPIVGVIAIAALIIEFFIW